MKRQLMFIDNSQIELFMYSVNQYFIISVER